jgi:hypothetical protein
MCGQVNKKNLAKVVVLFILILGAGCLSTEETYTEDFGDEAKYSLVAPNGLGFERIRGYEKWEIVATHYRTEKNELRYILGNEELIESYSEGAGKGAKAFKDGSILVKIGYSVKENPDWKASVEPDELQRVEYMVKDTSKYRETGGWNFVRFVYNSKTGEYSPFGEDKNFALECFDCHTRVERKDYVFTDYIWKG